MAQRSVIAGRFDVEGVAGSGGMAQVFTARDRTTGAKVAVKVLFDHSAVHADRFAREAALLEELRHPAIVRHVAHGVDAGELWLAMEWLEGQTLAQRLLAGGLAARESVELALRLAEGLGAAHARGVIHRDVKPSNVFLVGGGLDRVRILDFGIAHVREAGATMTRTGTMLGTPGYMAPEQARGVRGVDARADVFSLGCVLFECLTGRPPFVGDGPMAILAKILLEEVPRVSELEPSVTPELDALVSRMLAKEPAGRPRDGQEAAALLAALGDVGEGRPSSRSGGGAAPSLTIGEQRLLTVLLAGTPEQRGTTAHGTAILGAPKELPAELRSEVERAGGELDRLVDGSIVVTFVARGTATEQVMRAARCALALRALLPLTPIALATGRGVVAGRWPVGEAIDRASSLVQKALSASGGALGIRLDETTAGLLDSRFDVGGDAAGLELRGEREPEDGMRMVLGKAVPCVGRERELAALEAILAECVGEPVARVVLVTAAPGVGKSRLRAELVRRVQYRTDQRVEIWIGRGDPMSAGSPFGMLAEALRRAAGIRAGEPLLVRRRKLRARVARNVAAAEAPRVAAFLGELVGVPLPVAAPGEAPSSSSVQLEAARQDGRLMGDQMLRAWEDFIAAECAAQPVLLLLEDLHWGDFPTIRFVDAALRLASERPLMVLAFARPEVHELFPRLWEGRDLQTIRLQELKRAAAEKLVRAVLGPDAPDALVGSLVDRAAGNAFYLEELVRAVADGKGSALPETVIAMVQSRLESLEQGARHLLRAASVFGQVFWSGGLGALLGGSARTIAVGEWLEELTAREIISPRRDTRFPGEAEYTFRHALVREAAYAMLTEADRALGHRLAGAWLRAAGETDAVAMAEHFERGGELSSAAKSWRVAAEQALEGDDLAAAIARAERGARVGARGAELGALRLAQGKAHAWRAEYPEAHERALEAMERLPRASAAWLEAAGAVAESAGRLGQEERLAWVAIELVGVGSVEGTHRAYAGAAARTAAALLGAGRYAECEGLLERLRALEPHVAQDPIAVAWIRNAFSWERMIAGDIGACLALDSAVAAGFAEVGDHRLACEHRANVAYDMMSLGAYPQAEDEFRAALPAAERLGLASIVAMIHHNLGLVLALRGAYDEARVAEEAAIAAYVAQSDRRMEGGSRSYLALIALGAGDVAGAEAECRRAVDMLTSAPPVRAQSLAILARVCLSRADLDGAFACATEAMEALVALGGIGEGEALVRLVHAEVLHATGATHAGLSAIRAARERLLARAAKISDPGWRESFLERVPDHARTLALAAEWLGEG